MADENETARIKALIEVDAAALSDVRLAAEDDQKFAILGEQWDEKQLAIRKKKGRPALVLNRQPSFIRHVVNGARQDERTCRVYPISSGADRAASELLDRRIRAIQLASDAPAARETALESAVVGGFGWYRVVLDELPSGDLEPCVEPIRDSLSVIWDTSAIRPDRSDIRHLAVVVSMTRKEFAAKYDQEPASFEGISIWTPSEDCVSICEFWERDEQDKVTVSILSGAGVIETQEHPGHLIPFVFVPGEEYFVDGKVVFKGIVRDGKEAQRFHNYYRSEIAEALNSKKTPRAIVDSTSIVGKDGEVYPEWKDADGNYAYSRVNPNAAFPPSFPPAAQVPTGVVQAAEQSIDDMKAIIGIYDASLGARSNEQSGRAIQARAAQGDLATFHFRKALDRAVRVEGLILLDLVLAVDKPKKWLNLAAEDGEITTQEMGGVMKLRDGKEVPAALQEGHYGIVVKAGVNYTTRREQTTEVLAQIGQAYPQIAQFGADLVAKNLDIPEADMMADRMRASMEKQGLIEPKDQEGTQQIPQAVRQQMEQAAQAMEQLGQHVEQLTQENQALQQAAQGKQAQIQADQQAALLQAQIDAQTVVEKARIDAEAKIQAAQIQAETDRQVALIKRQTELDIAGMKEEGATNRQAMKAESDLDQTALSAALTPPPALPPEEPMEYFIPGASDPEGL
jgi:hypothetical protein